MKSKNRGVQDVLIFAIDGLTGFNQAIEAVYPKAEIQRCIVHQIRSSLKYVSWNDRKSVAYDFKTLFSWIQLGEEGTKGFKKEFLPKKEVVVWLKGNRFRFHQD